jgi:hypothetical protein
MQWFWNKKRVQQEVANHVEQSSVKVHELQQKTHKTTAKAEKDIDRLNKLLKANGITLKIHIAAGGSHG